MCFNSVLGVGETYICKLEKGEALMVYKVKEMVGEETCKYMEVAGMVKEEVGTCKHKEEVGTEMEEGEIYKRTEVVVNVLEAGENYKRTEVVENVLEAGETCTRMEVVVNVLEEAEQKVENSRQKEVVGNGKGEVDVVENRLERGRLINRISEAVDECFGGGETCTLYVRWGECDGEVVTCTRTEWMGDCDWRWWRVVHITEGGG
ncbi:hypothetical protein Tco_1522889 [Tanacetum coccineum]